MMQVLIRNYRRFVLAITLLTKFPVTSNHQFGEKEISKASIYFPVVGFLIGFLAWGVFFILRNVLPHTILVFILLVFLTFITGAMHEDGLADTFDSFGGHTQARALEIMKDSRIGTYGASALLLLLLGKYVVLLEIDVDVLPRAIIAALVLGRWSSLPLFRGLKYVQHTHGLGRSFVRHLDKIGMLSLFISTVFSFGLVVLIFGVMGFCLILMASIVLLLSMLFFRRRVGGVTGDIGGAVIQFVELAVYLVIVVL